MRMRNAANDSILRFIDSSYFTKIICISLTTSSSVGVASIWLECYNGNSPCNRNCFLGVTPYLVPCSFLNPVNAGKTNGLILRNSFGSTFESTAPLNYSSRPKLQLGSVHVKIDVWTRPKSWFKRKPNGKILRNTFLSEYCGNSFGICNVRWARHLTLHIFDIYHSLLIPQYSREMAFFSDQFLRDVLFFAVGGVSSVAIVKIWENRESLLREIRRRFDSNETEKVDKDM